MAHYHAFGGQIVVDGHLIEPRAKSFDDTAWTNEHYLTFELTTPLRGFRFHTDGVDLPGRAASGEEGRWMSFGDVILPRDEIVQTLALPGYFSHLSLVIAPIGCVINLGVVAPKWKGRGTGLQPEYVRGEPFIFRRTDMTSFADDYAYAEGRPGAYPKGPLSAASDRSPRSAFPPPPPHRSRACRHARCPGARHAPSPTPI